MSARSKNVRLYLVGGFFVALMLVVWFRLVQVQIFSRGYYTDRATIQWKVTKDVPPIRGGIFDRGGQPLALSIRSCSVSLRPQDVVQRDRVTAVLSKELDVSKRSVRKALRSGKSFVYVKRQCSLTDEARARLKQLRGVDVTWEADRVYPFGATAGKLVGFVGHDSKGRAGIEAAFDHVLSGEPGWEEVQRDGTYRSRGYHTYAEQKPVDGRHVVLTIDTALQEIAEIELARAIARSDAKTGAMIVLDVENGDILALAEEPSAPDREGESLVDSLWTLRSISNIYEPGSTFKLVTAAALLETSRVRSFDVFDAENGRADMGAAVISDSHPYGHLTFREGFVFSSNIVMAKASLALDSRDFFKFVRLFGFGAKTGVRLLGESPGTVAAIEDWSQRTQMTMSFGQEIGVTPLQMASAFAAVANDGILMAPRIIKSIVDEKSGQIETLDPIKVRRVVSEDTARRLRNFCRSVVEEGTGTEAQVTYLKVCGKTGTAEKASGGTYSKHDFVASFIGFAPYEDPRIVCLVMLDEPNYYYRFGGLSAAPAFSRMMSAIANSTAMFDDVLEHEVIGDTPTRDSDHVAAPNFLRLDRERAMAKARESDFNVLCKGTEGEVVSQDPDPGVLMHADDVVRLYLAAPERGGARQSAPDLRGLSIRAARRKALQAGFACSVTGSGVVSSQQPAPGAKTSAGIVRVHCKNVADGRRNG